MNLRYIIRVIPFLSTLLLLILLNIGNNKQDTNLKILIWQTPILSLGTYLFLSTGAGFIFSYAMTTYVANTNQLRLTKSIKYKVDNNEEDLTQYIEKDISTSYEKTLIERDVKDPSPTVNANFRVIGKTNRSNESFIINNYSNFQHDESNEFQDNDYQSQDFDETKNQKEFMSSDWNDETFLSW